ncbi:MAG: lipoyl(octanoyl) transferase LipB [Bacteroidales bacterium]|nr:lipoyl(octanoyl) transferase LipB [Bacteroidales bacterium]
MSYSVKYEDIGLKDYKETWDYQAEIFKELVEGKKAGQYNNKSGTSSLHGTLIFVEHPHVYTLGKNGSENNLLLDFIQLRAKDAKFYRIDRGGDITYHGPGQIVGYPIFDLEELNIGLKEYIFRLEETIIDTIREFGLKGSRLEGGTGVWFDPEIQGKARKICAIGVKASRYVTMHGFAFNVNTDLSYFNYINPCGFTDKGVTSLEKETGKRQEMNKVKNIIRKKFRDTFDLDWTE